MRSDDPVYKILKSVAPGTGLRDGLDNVLRAKTGALIVVGSNEALEPLVDGGFYINCDLTPANLYELAKMDGAIIVSEDRKKILYANTLLLPESSIPSTETGIRHRTAERVAKQTKQLVVSISQRRNVITLYKGNWRYALKDIGVILGKANQAIQTLDKYKSVLDKGLINLSALEFEEIVTFNEVAAVIQRIEMVLRIKEEIEKYIVELGTEGRLISMQLEELVAGVELESYLVIKDYCNDSEERSALDVLKNELKNLSADELLEPENIINILGYPPTVNIGEKIVYPRGFRALTKVPRIPISVIDNLIEYYGKLTNIVNASMEELDLIDGIGEVRAKLIADGLRRIREQAFFERHI
ncbi:DNA integrity scanning diadenylate cyclase DisA [Desulfuribacillus alkaliarsenatis]|uniref:diadenylate cyclase n=1 Tax=Desulfuribacillus alkaliarsenatis TaxID=766136 RepID=A0A1E5G4E2_9FIRM|nr:DNA integrity scanning diadenylate cyclase DisA [Desulfuribacillus alkaliarsenatis]OEF97967.1 DNA integrity scanning protein DisA [Desulfuribacillus alkaliarsenatis]